MGGQLRLRTLRLLGQCPATPLHLSPCCRRPCLAPCPHFMKLQDHAGEKGLPGRPLGRVAAPGEPRQGPLCLFFSRGEGDQQPVRRPGMERGGWGRGLQRTRAFTASDSAPASGSLRPPWPPVWGPPCSLWLRQQGLSPQPPHCSAWALALPHSKNGVQMT